MKWIPIKEIVCRRQFNALCVGGLLAILLAACEPVEDKSKIKRNVSPVSGAVSVSGTITIASGSMVDSDVNDANAKYIANDSIAQAQAISNPVMLGGYVNMPNAGAAGRSYRAGDTDDYYMLQLLARQTITITIADYNRPPRGSNVVVLQLLNENGDVLKRTVGDRATDVISVDNDGLFYLRVNAVAGASNYILNVGLSSQQLGKRLASGGLGVNDDLSIDDDFVPGDVIVELVATSKISTQAVTIASSANAVGLQAKAGAPDRSMLMSVGDGALRLNALSAFGIQAAPPRRDGVLQRKRETLEVIKALRNRDDIKSARPNYIRQPLLTPDDNFYSFQWHYPQINLPQTWEVETGAEDVIVAVIDTGVLLNHPDLQGKLVKGYDFIRSAASAADGDGIDNDPDDVGDDANGNSSFHGTHVSGTIAAATNNSTGVAGIAWNSKVMPLRALGRLGGTDYDIEQAVRYAAQLPNDSGTIPPQKADVINLSLGGPTNNTTASTAFRLARDAGVIVVAAAGNSGDDGFSYPASLDGVVSVSAVGINQNIASYSNFGTTIDVAAPGGAFTDLNGDGFNDGVLSTAASDANGTIEFGYAFYQGTSMAAPHIAGIAALMRSVNSQLSPADFDRLLSSGVMTKDLGASGRDDQYGYGLIDAYRAVNAAKSLAGIPLEPRNPIADVTPAALNFGYVTESIDFNVANGADGVLSVRNITNTSNGWLLVTASSVNASGLGRYTASVDRSLLPLQTKTYAATISLATSVSVVDIPIIMQIINNSAVTDAGLHYVELKDGASSKTLYKVQAQLSKGEYTYRFDNVAAGKYIIVAGTDSDSDNAICEVAEACGAYPMPNNVLNIDVDGISGNKSDINFETSFGNVLSSTLSSTLSSRVESETLNHHRYEMKMGPLLQ